MKKLVLLLSVLALSLLLTACPPSDAQLRAQALALIDGAGTGIADYAQGDVLVLATPESLERLRASIEAASPWRGTEALDEGGGMSLPGQACGTTDYFAVAADDGQRAHLVFTDADRDYWREYHAQVTDSTVWRAEIVAWLDDLIQNGGNAADYTEGYGCLSSADTLTRIRDAAQTAELLDYTGTAFATSRGPSFKAGGKGIGDPDMFFIVTAYGRHIGFHYPQETGTYLRTLANWHEPDVQKTYIVADGRFLGACNYESWFPLGDWPFLLADVLAAPQYRLYGQQGPLGAADQVELSPHDGLSGYASPHDSWLQGYSVAHREEGNWHTYDLPPALLPQHRGIPVPDYNAYMGFDGRRPGLALSDETDPLPRTVRPVAADAAAQAAVRAALDAGGLTGAPVNITAALACDIDGSGSPSTVIVANTPHSDSGTLMVSQAEVEAGDSGAYGLVLCIDALGQAVTVYGEMRPYTQTVGFFSQASGELLYMDDALLFESAGLFDLNGDGVYEIVTTVGLWEGGYTVAHALDADGAWRQVLDSWFGA